MRFRCAHAAHPDWSVAVEQCLLLLGQQTGAAGFVREPNLGFVYLTDALLRYANEILSSLKARTGVSSWVGASGAGICATGVEYMDEPALAVMLGQFAPGTFNVFSGKQRPPALVTRTASGGHAAWTALVHADPKSAELPGMLTDMSHKLASGYLFGGVASGRHPPVQVADQVLSGGLSGVVFAQDVPIVSRVTQGCFPLRGARAHMVTQAREHQVLELDHQRAFDVLLADAGLRDAPHAVAGTSGSGASAPALDARVRSAIRSLARQGLFVGIEPGGDPPRDDAYRERLRADYTARHVVALDPGSGAITIAGDAASGQRLTFCTRDEQAARKDLVRICSEVRDAAQDAGVLAARAPQSRPGAAREPGSRAIQGALYFSCLGRGGHMFGEQGEELRLIQSQLGAVPLVGLYAGGEIGGRNLYGYTGVLSVFPSA